MPSMWSIDLQFVWERRFTDLKRNVLTLFVVYSSSVAHENVSQESLSRHVGVIRCRARSSLWIFLRGRGMKNAIQASVVSGDWESVGTKCREYKPDAQVLKLRSFECLVSRRDYRE